MTKWMKTIASIILLMALISGCKGCLSKFYAVHEEVEYLNIVFVDSSVNSTSVLYYIDSIISKDNNLYEVTKSINAVALGEEDRVIQFKKPPEEFYQVSCNAKPCWIKGIFNKTFDSVNWMYSRKFLNETEIKRIEQRFRIEILRKAEEYAIAHRK